jgi:hypothetical protein
MSTTAVLALIGTVVTAVSAYIVAKLNTKTDRQKFYEDKITLLLETQSKEILALKTEIEKLTNENHKLNLQVLELTIKLEKRESANHEKDSEKTER